MSAPDINERLRARPRPCRYGAPMGYRNHCAERDHGRAGMLYCQRIRFEDGDYGPDGTYWGGGSPLYAVFSADLETLCYYRAESRVQALQAFAEDYP